VFTEPIQQKISYFAKANSILWLSLAAALFSGIDSLIITKVISKYCINLNSFTVALLAIVLNAK